MVCFCCFTLILVHSIKAKQYHAYRNAGICMQLSWVVQGWSQQVFIMNGNGHPKGFHHPVKLESAEGKGKDPLFPF